MERLKRFLWRGKLRKAATILVGGFVVWVTIGGVAIAFEKDDKRAPPASQPTATATKIPTPEPAEAAGPTEPPRPAATAKPTSTTVPPTATAVPLDQRPEAEAIRQTIYGYFDAYNNAVENDQSHPFALILRYVDSRADGECGGLIAHGWAYIIMRRYMRERWVVNSIFDNENDELDAENGTAWVTVQLSSFDLDTGEPVMEWTPGYHFKTDDLSPTGWVFTAGPDETSIYADGHKGPGYDPLPEVAQFCAH